MKAINLKSLIDAEQLGEELYAKFLEYYGLSIKTSNKGQGIKAHEVATIKALLQNLSEFAGEEFPLLLEDFFIGYHIPQIGKEFDLLRFGQIEGQKTLINIELKSESTEDKILEQLLKNEYYLSFMHHDLKLFSYNQAKNSLYILEDKKLRKLKSFSELTSLLGRHKSEAIGEIDKLFDPANYLVSPFNATDKFLLGEYFLTGHQKDIKDKHIIPQVLKGEVSFMAITGGAGTGKTLLTYDIAKSLKSLSKSVLIVHCGILNEGQKELRANDWAIISVKNIKDIELKNYDLLIIDEAQRLNKEEFTYLKENIEASLHCQCLFSYDSLQWLKAQERDSDIIKNIEGIVGYQAGLTDKIRTNHEIASFIKRLLNNKASKISHLPYPNIKLHYVANSEEAKLLLFKLRQSNWKIANYTPSRRQPFSYESYALREEDNAHTIIGQEYDKVVAVLDESFYYNVSGTLTVRTKQTNDAYYDQERMLYQILTRVRRELAIIVINNPIVLSRCLAILLQ